MSVIIGIKKYSDVPGLYTEISIDGNIYNDEIMGKKEDRSIINNINKKCLTVDGQLETVVQTV